MPDCAEKGPLLRPDESARARYGAMAGERDKLDEAMLGLFDHALPMKGTPQHSPYRILASCTLLAFIVIASWTALSTLGEAGDGAMSSSWASEMSWVRSSGVSWGRPQAAPAAASAAADGTSASIADADATLFELDAEDGMNPQLLDDADLVHVAKRPDYGRYLWHVDLAFDPKSAGRLIVVGDVHGMVGSLRTLLDALRFDKAVDQLVLAGDIVSKAPAISASLDTIKLARKMGAESVRGNHDQAVIGWRAWMDAFGYVVGEAIGDDDDATHADSSWLQSTAPPASVKPKIPKGWKWQSQHFEIARSMSRGDYKWLLDRPLTLHIRSLHTYVVHAGLLPDHVPKSGRRHRRQAAEDPSIFPSPMPSEHHAIFAPDASLNTTLCSSAERGVLALRQNRDPFTLLNMRGVTKHGTKPNRDGKKGQPWMSLWEAAQADCADSSKQEVEAAKACRPLSIIYGHWAARGLELGTWAAGLDSGCVYGRRLSALVVEGDDRSRRRSTRPRRLADRQAVDAGADDDEDVRPEDASVDASSHLRLEASDLVLGGRTAKAYSIACPVP